MKGFKNFLMQGNLIVVAVALVVALAFSTLIKAFTDNIITPLVNAAGGGGTSGLGFTVKGQVVNFGAFISAAIYFAIFMAVIYFVLVVPYRSYMARRGTSASAILRRPKPAPTACRETSRWQQRNAATAPAKCQSRHNQNTERDPTITSALKDSGKLGGFTKPGVVRDLQQSEGGSGGTRPTPARDRGRPPAQADPSRMSASSRSSTVANPCPATALRDARDRLAAKVGDWLPVPQP